MVKLRATLRACAILAVAVSLSCSPSDRVVEPQLEPQLTTVTVGQTTYTRIEERAPSNQPLLVSKVIGLLGGTLSVAGHTVTVPFGAVTTSTLFTLRVPANGYVEIEANAILTDLLGRVINIGALGFNKPVTVSLSYARATNVTDPSRLKIMRLMPNGQHEILPSTVHSGPQVVRARLEHFSAYCMVTD